MDFAFTVRRIRPEDWRQLRALRLEALAGAPMAFGSTLAKEASQQDVFWQERAARAAADPDRTTVIAAREERWCGCATAVQEEGGAGERPVWIFGMWVDPAARRRGVARALLGELAAWARGVGADVMNLHVTETNAAAIAFYEQLGFRATGATQPLPHDHRVLERHMVCPLEAFGARRAEGRG